MTRPTHRLKILIADDDRASALLLRKTLEGMGHEVVAAADGADAWERLQREEFRLVISDWVMPGLDGLEFCRRVRGYGPGGLYTYVILLTARSGRADRVAGYEAGADDFLAKPLDPGELMARVGAAQRIIAMQEELHRRSRQLEAMHDELQRQYERLTEVATSDGLTGLKNRRHFREVLDSTFSFASRQRLPLSVVMLDVDHFKHYNDTFGHPAGDAALSEIARLLRDNARDHDLVARYGGEEFVLILTATDGPGARQLCDRLRAAIESRPWPLRPITASFGVATSSHLTLSGLQLVDEADRALYQSKRRGRNCVTHYDETRPILV